MVTMDISATSRRMIDARLDSIDRALMSKGVDRADRNQIISAIEDQILQMLDETGVEEPTRDDVLGILARLDPPEAYLELSDGDSFGDSVVSATNQHRVANLGSSPNTAQRYNVLAIVAIALVCSVWIAIPLVYLLESELMAIVAFITTIASGFCSTVALSQFASNRERRRGLWMAVTANCVVLTMLTIFAVLSFLQN